MESSKFKSYKDISKSAQWGTDEVSDFKNWGCIKKGLRIREVEALEKMAANYQHLLDEVERYREGYRNQKNKCESLENELRQLRSVNSRYRNQRDRLKEQLQENQIAL